MEITEEYITQELSAVRSRIAECETAIQTLQCELLGLRGIEAALSVMDGRLRATTDEEAATWRFGARKEVSRGVSDL